MKNQIKKSYLNVLGLIISMLIISTVCFAQRSGKANTENIKRKWLDVAYASQSQAQKLDIYLPDEGDGPFPVIISIHGGAFKGGDKADGQVTPMLEGLKRRYAVVSINYRLSGEAIFPAQIYDVKAAVRWIRANANQYKLNGEKMAAWGGSAGGHLSALLGTSGGVKELEDLTQGNATQSSRVIAVVDWFGPTDFMKMDEQLNESGFGPSNHNEADSPESRYLGAKLSDIPLQVELANPMTYIHVHMPPILIQHGSLDTMVPVQQSIIFAEKIKKYVGDDRFEFDIIEGAGHGDPLFETPENMNRVFSFLDKHLKKPA